jgi:hypothetical protein
MRLFSPPRRRERRGYAAEGVPSYPARSIEYKHVTEKPATESPWRGLEGSVSGSGRDYPGAMGSPLGLEQKQDQSNHKRKTIDHAGDSVGPGRRVGNKPRCVVRHAERLRSLVRFTKPQEKTSSAQEGIRVDLLAQGDCWQALTDSRRVSAFTGLGEPASVPGLLGARSYQSNCGSPLWPRRGPLSLSSLQVRSGSRRLERSRQRPPDS